MNSNLSVDYDSYESIVSCLDVLLISHNWGIADAFVESAFAKMDKKPS